MSRRTKMYFKPCAGRGPALVAAVAILLQPEAAMSAGKALEEVVVTARKREENARNIPVAVSVLSEETLESYNTDDLEDVADLMPQLDIVRASAGSGASINIRGISSTSTSIGIEQSVAVVIDGVYYGFGRAINEGMFDVSQVSVLKGPQALFFGKNSPAGAINIKTNDPSEAFELSGDIGYEVETQERYVEAVVSGPVTDRLGARLAVRWSDMDDGYMENQSDATTYTTTDVATSTTTVHDVPPPSDRDYPGAEEQMARLTLRHDATSRLSFELKGSASSYESISTNGNSELRACPATGVSQVSGRPCKGNWKNAENPFPEGFAETNPLWNGRDGQLFDDYESYSVTGTADYELPLVSLTSVVNYQDIQNQWGGDFDNTGEFNNVAGENTEYDAFSFELRGLTNFEGPVNFLLGGYYQTTERDFEQDLASFGVQNSAVANPANEFVAKGNQSGTEGETYSAFGQVIWNFLPGWELTAGARYLEESKDSFFVQPYVNPSLRSLYLADERIGADQEFDDVTPEVTLRWQMTDQVTLYGAYKEGFKSGGFSISGILSALSPSVDAFTFEPEQSKGVEAGVRASLLDGTLRLQAEGYDYEFEDLQVDFFNAPTFAYITTNAGSAKTTGAEIQAQWAPPIARELRLNASVAYNDARYEDFVAPCYAGQTPSAGCTIFEPGVVPQQDISGEPRNLAPDWSANLGVDYDQPIVLAGRALTMGLSLNAQYKGDYQGNQFAHPADVQDAYARLDAALRLGSQDERWQLSVIGRNLTDRYAFLSSGDAPGSGGGTGTPEGILADRTATPIEPRTIAVELSLSY